MFVLTALNLSQPQIYRILKKLELQNKIILSGKSWKIKK